MNIDYVYVMCLYEDVMVSFILKCNWAVFKPDEEIHIIHQSECEALERKQSHPEYKLQHDI